MDLATNQLMQLGLVAFAVEIDSMLQDGHSCWLLERMVSANGTAHTGLEGFIGLTPIFDGHRNASAVKCTHNRFGFTWYRKCC